MTQKRAGMTRFNRGHVQALRDEMSKCPNQVYGQMVAKGQMTDSDMIDFALCLANSYFDGTLLQVFKETAKANLTMQMRRAVLVTAAFFGCTAEFDKDGMSIRRLGDDSDLITFAVQSLVDVGFSVAEAMRQLEPPPPAPCKMESDINTKLPELVH